jgi:ATP/maltotriose-dependent transcriptional regulator MalT
MPLKHRSAGEYRDMPRARLPVGGAERPADQGCCQRELDVLRLIAGSLSNAEIGARLFIGKGTLKTHVTRVTLFPRRS